MIAEGGDIPAVVTRQAVVGSNPDISPEILNSMQAKVGRKAIFPCKVGKIHLIIRLV
jgi:hypothetical protein